MTPPRLPPLLAWLRAYDRSWLRADVVAGATVWAVLVPSALAYSGIVGVEPIVGLATVPLALVGYAVFGGSRLLVVGPDAAIAVLAAATVAPLVSGDDYLDLVVTLTLLSGGIHLVLFAFRMGWVADLVPDPVLRGFVQGLVWVTIVDQVPKLLGFRGFDSPDGFFRTVVEVGRSLDGAHAETALLGVSCLVLLFGVKRFVPQAPGPLVVVALSLVAVALLGLDADGVAVVGEPTGKAFDLGLPTGISLDQVTDLLPGALAIVILGFTESNGAAKAAAATTGERLDPDQELLALGVSNLGAGISGGYVVTGALSKTSVAVGSGGRTQLANLTAAVLAVATILFLRPLLEELALTALAAIVIAAMSGMADVAYFRALWGASRLELTIAGVAFLGVLTVGVLPGVVVAVLLSLVVLIGHIGDPPTSVLGRTPTGAWRALDRGDDAEPVVGMVVWRQEAPLVFLNARRLTNQLRDLVDDETDVIVVDASAVSALDSTGLGAFMSTADELRAAGYELWVVGPTLRILERAARFAGAAGRELPPVFDSLDDALAAFERRRGEA